MPKYHERSSPPALGVLYPHHVADAMAASAGLLMVAKVVSGGSAARDLVYGAQYTVTLAYQDAVRNAVASVSHSSIIYGALCHKYACDVAFVADARLRSTHRSCAMLPILAIAQHHQQ